MLAGDAAFACGVNINVSSIAWICGRFGDVCLGEGSNDVLCIAACDGVAVG